MHLSKSENTSIRKRFRLLPLYMLCLQYFFLALSFWDLTLIMFIPSSPTNCILFFFLVPSIAHYPVMHGRDFIIIPFSPSITSSLIWWAFTRCFVIRTSYGLSYFFIIAVLDKCKFCFKRCSRTHNICSSFIYLDCNTLFQCFCYK